MKFFRLILLSSIFAFSCGKDEEKTPSQDTTPAKINPSLLTTSNDLTPRSKEDLEFFLGEGDFFANSPDKFLKKIKLIKIRHAKIKKNKKSEFIPCLQESGIRIQATEQSVKIKQKVDISSCMKDFIEVVLEDSFGLGTEVIKSTAHLDIDAEWRCPSGDLSTLNDRGLFDSIDQDLEGVCQKSYNVFMKVQVTTEIEIDSEKGAGLFSTDFVKTLSTPNGKECTYQRENQTITLNNCVSMEKWENLSEFEGDSKIERNFTKVTAVNLSKRMDNSNIFFESGQHQVQFNNWAGSVKHHSDYFDFTMTNTAGENLQGSYKPIEGL